AEGHHRYIEPELELEQLAGEVRGRAGARLSVAIFAGIGFRQCDQLLDRLRRNRWVHRDHIGRSRDQADRSEILDRVRYLRIEAGVDDEAGADSDESIAVGGSTQGVG